MAAAFAVPAAILLVILAGGLASAVPAQASPAEQASSGRLSVTIDAMNPSYAVPGARVTVSGTVTNGTRQTRAGLNVQLYTSASPFTTRDGLDAYMSHGVVSDLIPAGEPFVISAGVAPGATASWTASFRAGTQGISSFGVYAVTAQLQDPSGGVISSDQTLLPFWPGSRSAGLARPLAISWLLPLIDQPHQKVCTATLTSNDLASSIGQGGRLSALLKAGASHPGADLTWFIDPALLSDVATMTRQYLVGGQPTCTLASREPASAAAASWLAGLRQQVTAGQSAVLTPYANVDMAALVRQGLTRDLAAAYRTGEAVAASVLHKSIRHDIAWPPGGTADLSLLTNLAAHQHVGTVVLNSDEMPPVVDAASVFQPDDAVASLRVAGLPMNVLLSDDTLTKVLRAGNTSSGTLPTSTEFAVRQRFLAETAMIAAEAPDSERTIVVAPPGNWSPSEALASDLLGETQTAPWLTPTPLASLSSAPDTQRAAPRHSPPASQPSPGELSRDYLRQVRILGNRVGVYKSMLYKPAESYTRPWTRPCSPPSRPPGAAAGSRRGPNWSAACPPTSRPRTRRSRSSPRARCRWAVPPGWSPCRSRTGCIRPSRSGWSHRGQHARPDIPADHRPLPEPGDHPAAAAGHGADAGQLGPAGIHPDPARPHQRERNGAAVHPHLAHRPVHQVRPGDPVPHRRRDRRPRAHLGVPRCPAMAARRRASCQRRTGPTG